MVGHLYTICTNCGNRNIEAAQYCTSCGKPLIGQSETQSQDAGVRPEDGGQLHEQPSHAQYSPTTPPVYNQGYYQQAYYGPPPRKDPVLAAVLAVIIIGLGHIYVGDIGLGVGLLVAAIVLTFISLFICFGVIVLFAVWLFQIYDAYNKAQQYNQRMENPAFPPR